jgi:uncharacterized membrane protein (UPF0127 family)
VPGLARRAAAMALLALCACPARSSADPPSRQKDVTARDYVPAPLATGHVMLASAFGGQAAVEVEIADTPEATERGLMWRRELTAGKGMLFVFEAVEDHNFWMKNTLIPLDLLFIGPDLRVAGVVEMAEPLSLTPRHVGRPSRYVLEVPGGWCAKAGVRAGAPVTLDLPGPR